MTEAYHGGGTWTRHLATFTAAGLVLALLGISGMLYNGSGPLLLGSQGAVILDAALTIGTVMMVIGIAVLLVRFR